MFNREKTYDLFISISIALTIASLFFLIWGLIDTLYSTFAVGISGYLVMYFSMLKSDYIKKKKQTMMMDVWGVQKPRVIILYPRNKIYNFFMGIFYIVAIGNIMMSLFNIYYPSVDIQIALMSIYCIHRTYSFKREYMRKTEEKLKTLEKMEENREY